MAKRGRRTRAVRMASVASDLVLAPSVMAMRLPLMLAEAGGASLKSESAGAVREKLTAFTDGVAAAQLAWMRSAMLLPFAFATAASPMAPLAEMAEAVTVAALAPAGRQVRRNHRRLTGRR